MDFLSYFSRIMISHSLLAALIIIAVIVLVGVLLNVFYFVTSYVERVPHGLEHELDEASDDDPHWMLAAAGNALYCVFCTVPCGVFCKTQNNIVLV